MARSEFPINSSTEVVTNFTTDTLTVTTLYYYPPSGIPKETFLFSTDPGDSDVPSACSASAFLPSDSAKEVAFSCALGSKAELWF